MSATAQPTASRQQGVGFQPRAQGMLSQYERSQTQVWRARAAAELQSIQDGLLGPNWRTHPRTAYLVGFLRGTTSRLHSDNARRN